MASIILPPGTAPASPSEGEIYYDNSAKQVKFRDNAGFKGLGGADLQGEPHIITKKLHPAYLGKLLDDTTSHSGDYGTEQADGRMYYYTDIAGSKPIHDPRIGAHFGSQRHEIASIQLLEQETATHGSNVYSIDGRNWMRCTGGGWSWINDGHGSRLKGGNVSSYPNMYIEVVGYFSGFNLCAYTDGNHKARYSLDGATEVATDYGNTTLPTPLGSRYVDPSSVVNIPISTTLGIHTIKLRSNGLEHDVHGIELIAQDTTSSSTKVQIQVPAQDVVSYGRKFSVSGTAQHYDPFNGFSSGNATTLATKVDTATSLGLAKWLHSSTYYRPYNGMRVVKWIDENGAIKTSVTVMPPNAKSIGDSSALTNANAKANASASNDTFYPTFEAHTTSVNEDNLHEVAKTFHYREFGNGAANGGTGATWADASMLSSDDNIAYVMDDGLTSLSAYDVAKSSSSECMKFSNANRYSYHTFIGTGVSFRSIESTDAKVHVAQNLPYGSHVLKIVRGGTHTLTIDGVDVQTGTLYSFAKIDIYQPKKPPIPESACVLADYMVFADFKPQTTAGTTLISKGVRRQNISRDVFFDETDGDNFSLGLDSTFDEGFNLSLSGNADSDTSMKMRIPSFGTNYLHKGYQSDSRVKLFIGDTDNDSNATKDNTASYGSYAHLTSDLTLGVHQFGANAVSGTNGLSTGFDIVTPIHTSHHYQTFETPYLHELIGGDRSMEQTNLICSSDGKSWDEITRDTGYLGPSGFNIGQPQDTSGGTAVLLFTSFRAAENYVADAFNKNWAIGYNRMICLEAGLYHLKYAFIENNGAEAFYIKLNNSEANGTGSILGGHTWNATWMNPHVSIIVNLNKNDFLTIYGINSANAGYVNFQAHKIS